MNKLITVAGLILGLLVAFLAGTERGKFTQGKKLTALHKAEITAYKQAFQDEAVNYVKKFVEEQEGVCEGRLDFMANACEGIIEHELILAEESCLADLEEVITLCGETLDLQQRAYDLELEKACGVVYE